MNEQPVRRGKQAQVDIKASGLATMSRDMEFEASYEGRTRNWQDAVEDDGTMSQVGLSRDEKGTVGGAVVSGVHPDRVRMWKPTPNGFSMRVIPVTAIKQNLQNGWKSYCPDCGGNQHDGGPNDCPGRAKVMYSVCPICPDDHRVYDNYQISAVSDFTELEKDPAFVQFDAYKNSTPQARVEAALTLHMWTRHPQETRAMGIAPLPEPSLTVLESMLQTGPNSNPIMGGGTT